MDHDRESTRQGDELGRSGSTGGVGGTGMGETSVPGAGQVGGPRTTGSEFGRGGIDESGARAGSYDRKFAGEESVTDRIGDKLHEGREQLGDKVEEGKERMEGAIDSGRNRIADQLERVGDRIEERARTMEDAGGVQRRAGHAARRTSEALDSSADYLRTHDVGEMRDDLEHAIRERPLMSVGMALGAGFLLARILRD
jgi:ElaB/YqjD/DUF883 family membrane-anchored ribosome-binding protein